MKITLQILNDIYGKPDKNGKQKLIKRNVQSKKQFETTAILIEEYLNSKGVPSKRWCMVKSDGEYFKVNHKYEHVERMIGHIEVKGFRYGNS